MTGPGDVMKVYERMAQALVAEQVDTVFALMGDGNMMFLDAAADLGIHVVHARHEGAALAMADGYARASGRVGVCTVTCGPGLTQVLTSLTVAKRHGSPVVLIAGDTPAGKARAGVGPTLQQLDQAAFVAAAGLPFRPMRDVAHVDEDLREAFATAQRDTIPVVIGAPIDLQADQIAPLEPYTPDAAPEPIASPPGVDEQALALAAERLATARRPVLLAGLGVVKADARDAMLALGDRVGGLLATTLLAKELFAGEPFDIGLAGGFSRSTARSLMQEADCLIAVGTTLSTHTMDKGSLFGSADIIHIDLEPRGRSDIFVRGDADLAVKRLLEMLGPRPAATTGLRTPEVAERLERRADVDDAGLAAELASLEPGTLHPLEVMRALDRLLGDEVIVVFGVGHFWWYPAITLSRPAPDSQFCTYAFGTIGQALPTAMGIALASGRPVVVIDGDGSVLMNVQELESLAREQLDLRLVVLNDGAYGAEVHKLAATGADPERARFGRPDFAAIARGFGVDGRRLSAPSQLKEIFDAAADGPLVIDVPMSATVVSEPYRRVLGIRD